MTFQYSSPVVQSTTIKEVNTACLTYDHWVLFANFTIRITLACAWFNNVLNIEEYTMQINDTSKIHMLQLFLFVHLFILIAHLFSGYMTLIQVSS